MKKENFFVKNYFLCGRYFSECKWYFVFSLGIFSLFFLIGFAFPIFFRETIINIIRELILSIEGKSLFDLIFYIFFNNLKVGFIAIAFSVMMGVVPFVILVSNSYILGFVSREVVEQQGIFLLWRLLPHGIFEMPAIFFSVGIGLKVGISLFKEKPLKNLKRNLIEGARFFLFVIVPFLIVAAIIEGVFIFYFK